MRYHIYTKNTLSTSINLLKSDIKADNFMIEPTGEVRLGGFRQIRKLQTCGEIQKSIFALVGDNIEWAAPEVIVQVIDINIEFKLYHKSRPLQFRHRRIGTNVQQNTILWVGCTKGFVM
jgi:hypothetical protein